MASNMLMGYRSLAYFKVIYLLFATLITSFILWHPHASAVDFILVFCAIIARIVLIIRTFKKRDFCYFVFWGYVDLSLIVWVGFSIVVEFPLMLSSILVLRTGIFLLILFTVWGGWKSPSMVEEKTYWRFLSNKQVMLICLFVISSAFFASFLAHYFGVAALGHHRNHLPFKIAGILEHYRYVLVPTFFLFTLDILYFKSRRFFYFFILIIAVWYGYEAVIRLSKGCLVQAVTIIAIWLVYRDLLKRLHIIYGMLIVLFALFMYKPMSLYRYESGGEFDYKVFVNLLGELDWDIVDSSYTGFRRRFLAGSHLGILIDEDYIEMVSFSDTKKLLYYKSPSKIMTHDVEHYALGVPHSSGTTIITEGLLIGGISFAVVLMFIFGFIGSWIDGGQLLSLSVSLQVVFFNLYQAVLNTGLVESYFCFSRIHVTLTLIPILYICIRYIRINSRRYIMC